jgi:predicted ATPase
LFIENGYQLTGEVFCLAQPDQFDEIPTSDVRGYAKLVRLFLVDAHQRRVEIEDVGSGIAYVLPILVALAGSRIALIQQPELHLHPALQSKLGDVIVKAVESKNGFEAFTLVETHSEHLLLRVMRLIRNASSRKQDDLVPLTNENVAILYFEPIGVGESRVKRLRLSAEGELIDRWPGGFFNERYKDIFDE